MPTLKRRVAKLEEPREEDYCAGCLKRLFAEPDGEACPVCGASKPAPLPISVARRILNGTGDALTFIQGVRSSSLRW